MAGLADYPSATKLHVLYPGVRSDAAGVDTVDHGHRAGSDVFLEYD